MKLTISTLGMLAGVASAVSPHHNLYFPRSNTTLATPAENRVAQPAQPGPVVPLGTGAPAYAPPPSQPQRPAQVAPANPPAPAYSQPLAQPQAPPAPVKVATQGADSQTTVITTTMSSTIHKTITKYVRPTGAPAVAGGSMTTTTIISKPTSTITVSRVKPAAGPSGVIALENKDQDNEQCAPATVTVTAAPVATTVYVTVTPDAVPPPVRVPAGGRQPPLAPRPPPNGGRGQGGPGSTLTVLSTATVVPYPVGGGNGTQPIGYARPTGFARLRR